MPILNLIEIDSTILLHQINFAACLM